MLSRAMFCFRSNVAALTANGRSYLWTFTFADAVDYLALRSAWNRLLTALQRRLPAWSGVRVYEVHPGKWGEFSHGLHVHVVTNARFEVDTVRGVAEACGWGRVHVVRQKYSMREVLAHYLAKYLSKKRPFALKGWRLWACFNMPDRVRLGDIVIDSLRSNLLRIAHQTGLVDGMDWGSLNRVVARWEWQVVAGERLVIPWKWLGRKGGARHYAVRWRNVDLPWPFHGKLPRVSTTNNFSSWSAMAGGEDVFLSDVAREKAFRRSLALGRLQ